MRESEYTYIYICNSWTTCYNWLNKYVRDLENSIVSCFIGIIGIFVLYGLVTGAMDFMFWLGYQIGPGYAILVMILLIVCPIVFLYLYDKSKSGSNNNNSSFKPKTKIKGTVRNWKQCPKCKNNLPSNVMLLLWL